MPSVYDALLEVERSGAFCASSEAALRTRLLDLDTWLYGYRLAAVMNRLDDPGRDLLPTLTRQWVSTGRTSSASLGLVATLLLQAGDGGRHGRRSGVL